MSTKPTRVLVLGGGFAGLAVVTELERLARTGPALEITLVNRDNFTLFTPMLHEVAASDLDLGDIVNPIRRLIPGTTLVVGEVERIDLIGRNVTISHGDGHHHHELPYDHLVIALGSVTNYYGVPGVAERALTMKTLSDAIRLRNRLIAYLEQADFECAAAERHALLTFVVAGGGFAGVETVAGSNDFVRGALKHYRNLRNADVRFQLVHAGPVILPELSEKLGKYAQTKLSRRGVEIRLNTTVTACIEDEIELSDGSRVPARTLIWTAGSAGHPLLADLPCALQSGRLVTDEYLAVREWPGVWCAGDCAAIVDRRSGRFYPPTAQHAVRQGRVLAQNLVASLTGGRLRPFSFSMLGQLAAIGRRAGVANLLGWNFSGFVAWWLWRTIYLAKLPRLEKKVRVALAWTLDLLFDKDLVQFESRRATTVSHAEHNLEVELAPAGAQR
jgi:NADH:ubiquinone reductase (H+-translocating)